MTERSVTVEDMMRARDARAARQRRLLEKGDALVSLTMNIAGPVKAGPLFEYAFSEAVRLTEDVLKGFPSPIACETVRESTGYEKFWLINANATALKKALCALEDGSPLGRLMDIDVLEKSGEKCSREALGLSQRACLICGGPVFACARSRRHSVAELQKRTKEIILAHKAERLPDYIAEKAVSALILEADTTPKPGLVDKNNTGSHKDMTLALLYQSAEALYPYFRSSARIGRDAEDERAVWPALREAGIAAERLMLQTTGGINTHKGAIFSLGLLCAAAARLSARDASFSPEDVCRLAGDIAREPMTRFFSGLTGETARSFGERAYIAYGFRGIRGEAADGFPALTETALPSLRKSLDDGLSLNDAGARALIRLLARGGDTTLLKRGGKDKAEEAVRAARTLLLSDPITDGMLAALDDRFIAENLTCGGCADLLACAYFLYAF